MSEFALECRDISVQFGDVTALRQISCGFAPGRIHAVVGQNGAGKTTFARVCAGIVRPTSGRMLINGQDVPVGNVNQSRAAGVELVHQSFALPPSFTVAEAMEFGSQRRDGIVYSRSKLEDRWKHHLDSLNMHVKMGDRIRDLPVETQQSVEIARALVADAKILILDEPTAVLAPTAVEALFERVRRLQQKGVTILLILHKIREVLGIAETVTVLRGGRLVEGPLQAKDVDANRLASAIVGSTVAEGVEISNEDKAALLGGSDKAGQSYHAVTAQGAMALELKGVSTKPMSEGPALDSVDLRVGQSEIVGVAGVEGNGQRTLVQAIAGLVPMRSGLIALKGRNVTAATLIQRRAQGLRIIPFERYTEGLSLASALWENWAARGLLLGRLTRLINPAALRGASDKAFKQWDVRFSSVDQPAGSLSGGNAQKVILSREVDDDASLIVAAQPTRGLDVGATAFVWKSLREARAAKGRGILLISSDLDELFDISDRIVVMLSGKVVAEFKPPYDLGAVGAAMTGVRR